MTWSKDSWECHMCSQVTRKPGPWCDLYCRELGYDCPPVVAAKILKADAEGDGPLVNALCAAARRLYGEGLYW